MVAKMDRKCQDALAFIAAYIAQDGYAPTIREIQKGCSFSSTSVADYHLNHLKAGGHIECSRDSRAIRILNGAPGQVVVVFAGEEAALIHEAFGGNLRERLLAVAKKERAKAR